MTSHRLVTTFSAVALLSGLMAPVAAATAEAQARTRFADMDRNNDGRVTREEWRGSDRSFETHDWNGDGVLSGDEVRPGAQRNSDWETADHDPNRFERNISWTASGFSNLDHNRDGRLTTNEWHFDLETFRRIDRDRDNAITRPEFLGESANDDRGDNFDDLDWNNNGTVERAEWHGGVDEFRWLDRNSDGVLSRYEVAGADNSFDTDDQFQRLDYDRDGAISREEWHWSRNSFSQRDTNRDGVLSRREFDASGGSPGATPGGGVGSGARVDNQNVHVNAQQRWTDTGIVLRAGDIVMLNASGQIRMSSDPDDTATPAGSRRGRQAPDAPILNQLAGGLIGKIGDYPPMFIGDRTPVTAPVSGRLYLGVNDDHLPDNQGEFVVTVGVQGRTRR
jgi:Ca2+-binding EF-hand superfamily protein